jgi:DNA-binding LacI/PurR family transcriptional regulator
MIPVVENTAIVDSRKAVYSSKVLFLKPITVKVVFVSITIRDVAAAAGVSVATVSRVANGATNEYPIRPQTRERVLAAIAALGYRPNDNARGLLSKKSGLIGLVVPDISNPYYPEVSRGIEDIANAHGYKLMFCSTDRLADRASAYIEALLFKRVDGLVIVGGGDEIQLSAATVATYDTKVVFIGRPSASFSTVRIDNIGAAKDATEHLLSLGHTRVGFISATASSNTVPERRRGYREALEARGIAFDTDLVADGDFTEAGGYAAARRLLEVPNRPSGIFAANDRMALGAMAAVSDLGLRVPEDVAIVGFDDVPMSGYLRPSLTTVSVAAQELGTRAMEVLLKDINGQAALRRVRVKTRLVVRDSCGAHLR